MLMVSKSLSAGDPLSVTLTVTAYTPGPSASAGVQAKVPVVGLMPAAAGAPGSSEYVSCWGGVSESVAVATKVRGVPSLIDLFPIGAKTGGTLLPGMAV